MLTKCCPQVSFESTASALFQVPYSVSPLLAALTKTAGCIPTLPILELPDCRNTRERRRGCDAIPPVPNWPEGSQVLGVRDSSAGAEANQCDWEPTAECPATTTRKESEITMTV